METPHVTIYDCITGETISREMTEQEIAERQKMEAENKAYAEAKLAKEVARQAVLDKLGLTADEAAALLG